MEPRADEAGAAMVEYGFLLVGIAIVVALSLPPLAGRIAALYDAATVFFP